MKHLLSLIFIIIFNFSAFGQIDTSAWRGKTVLVIVEAHLNYDFYKSLNQEFAKNWYLTDSVHFIVDTLIKRDLDSFGEDTVVILQTSYWHKIFTNKGCCMGIPYDCLIWTLAYRIKFRNFKNQSWETYVFLLPNEKTSHGQKFQNLITNSVYTTSYEGKNIIVKNWLWSKEVEALIKQKFQNENFKIVESFGNEYADYQGNDAIFVYLQLHPKTNYIEIVDLKTNRVIEKIELEPK